MSDSTQGAWITAEAALSLLSVARQTLYAYVSRGLIETRPAPDNPKRNLYGRRSIEALLERQKRGRARQAVAASTIDFGEPVLVSRITSIAGGVLRYRSQDATELAERATLEEVAALLWGASALPALDASTYEPAEAGPSLVRCMRHIAGLTAPAIWGRHAAALQGDAALLLRQVAETLCGARSRESLHETMATAWNADLTVADTIRRALVLCADHELNASAFAVRVVASTGAALPACLLAGLAAMSGPLHGGMIERVNAMLAEPGMRTNPRAAVASRLGRGERLPGFGHRLYPDGDPRATALLAALDPDPWWRDVFAAVAEATGLRPNIDAALAALERTCSLPDGAAFAIFAAGRAAGWIAHALEQQQDGRLIRPRASYEPPT